MFRPVKSRVKFPSFSPHLLIPAQPPGHCCSFPRHWLWLKPEFNPDVETLNPTPDLGLCRTQKALHRHLLNEGMEPSEGATTEHGEYLAEMTDRKGRLSLAEASVVLTPLSMIMPAWGGDTFGDT